MTTSTASTIWFEAPTQVTGSPTAIGNQFADLFSDPSAWQVTSSQSTGLIIGTTFVLQATDAQLLQVFNYLKAHNMKLMMVAGMVPVQANGLGNGLEGFTTAAVISEAVQRIASLGGSLDWLAMDAPLSAGHEFASGPQLSITALAAQVATNVAIVKAVFPNVQFADGQGAVATTDLVQWAQAFQAATGSPIAEYDADVNWNLSNSLSTLETYAAAVRASGAALGISGDATNLQQTDVSWALAAEANIAAAEADPLTRPTNIMVESWDPNPTLVLPEGLSGTLSHVAVEISQFAPLYASGYLTGGQGVTVSTVVPPPSYVGSAADAVVGAAITVPGVKIVVGASPASAGMTFAVVVTAVSGTLGANASGAGHVTGAGTNIMTLTGDLADINAELASLAYTGSAAGTDTIDVTTYDGVGLVDDHQIAVAIATPITVPLPSGVAMATLYQNIFGQPASAATLNAANAAVAAGKTLAAVATPWIAQAQATISAMYEQVQGVSPTASVLGTLTVALMGGESALQIRTSLASATAVQSELAMFYHSHYGVAPTSSQLAALTQQVVSGSSLAAIEAPLLAMSQAETTITTAYQNIEGQAPDATDLATQARALLTGTSLATISNALALSPLVQGNLATLYQHVYDATPTTDQLAALTAELTAGTTYAQVVTQLTLVAQAAITGFFQSVLNRNPTAQELSTNTGNLMTGSISRGAILATLGYSSASAANVTAIYQQVFGQPPAQAMITAIEQFLCMNPTPLVQLQPDLLAASTLYQQITGQTITPAALLPLVYDFLNHATLSQIRLWVGFSGQENTIIETDYQNLFGHAISGDTLNTVKLALVAGNTTLAAAEAAFAAQAANDVPVISGVAAAQTTDANTHLFVLGAVNVTDPDPGAIETVTVKLNGGGTFIGNVTPTSWTATGTAANLTANLRGLTFSPAAAGGTTWLTLQVQNGTGHSATSTVAISAVSTRSPYGTTFLYAPPQGATPGQGVTIAAVAPAETFVMPATGFGAETITGFNLAQGVIELPKAIAASFAAVQSHEAALAGGTMISFGASESIYLPGVALGTLHAANLTFV